MTRILKQAIIGENPYGTSSQLLCSMLDAWQPIPKARKHGCSRGNCGPELWHTLLAFGAVLSRGLRIEWLDLQAIAMMDVRTTRYVWTCRRVASWSCKDQVVRNLLLATPYVLSIRPAEVVEVWRLNALPCHSQWSDGSTVTHTVQLQLLDAHI